MEIPASSTDSSIPNVVSTTTPPTTNPPPIFTIPNMNHTLYIKLNKDNYTFWKTQILAYLKGQDAYQFIDGTSLAPRQVIPNPSIEPGAPATIPNLEYMLWSQKDQMILNILISTLTELYVTHAVGCAITFDLWKTLVTMFASQANA
jgi:hypothetical protein